MHKTSTIPRRGLRLLLLVTLAGFYTLAHAAPQPRALTTVAAIRGLSSGEAASALPVHLSGIVTFYDKDEAMIFLQDATGAIFMQPRRPYSLVPGSRVEVWGNTADGYNPQVEVSDLREISRGPIPQPVALTYEQAARRENDCRYATLQGIVRSATIQQTGYSQLLLIELEVDRAMVDVEIINYRGIDLGQLLDTTVRITGNLEGDFNARDEIVGLELVVPRADGITVLKRAAKRPFDLPLTPVNQLVRSDDSLRQMYRIHTEGTVTLYYPGEELVLNSNHSALLVETRQMDPLTVGQKIEVTGFPTAIGGTPALKHGQFLVAGEGEPPEPHAISFEEAMTGKYRENVVTLQGRLISETREAHLDTLIIRSGDRLFQAVYRKRRDDFNDLPLYATGSQLRISGVCFVHVRGFWGSVESFQIRLRSREDVTVLARPTWWTIQHTLYVTASLLAIALIAIAWGLVMRHRVTLQAAIIRKKIESEVADQKRMAQLQRQRSQILELINSFESLESVFAAILEYMGEMWPGIFSYAHLLNDRKLTLIAATHSPTKDSGYLEVIDARNSPEVCARAIRAKKLVTSPLAINTWSRPLVSSNGEILGTLTVEGATKEEILFNAEALDFGCSLASIAIDNRRLYEDIVRLAHHDPLTALPNRALLDLRLNEALERAREHHNRAGLLYIDVDRFKSVNDNHSHKIGDLYLCAMAQRFRSCLRECDTLARFGGDEFVAVIPDINEIGQASEIAARLIKTMQDPFVLEGITIYGAASVGMAVFPDSGSTAEELQRVADAAMYSAKQSGGNRFYVPRFHPSSELRVRVERSTQLR